jgi:hypothetical protein
VVRAVSPHLLHGNHQQEGPKVAAGGNVVKAVACPFEKTSKNGLDYVLGIEAMGQILAGFFLGERSESIGVASIQLGGGPLVSVPQFHQE